MIFFTLNLHLTELVIQIINQDCGKTVNIINKATNDHNDHQLQSKDHCENSLHKSLTIYSVSFNIRPHFLTVCSIGCFARATTTDGLA